VARPIPVPAPVTRATGAAPSVIEFLSRQGTGSVDCSDERVRARPSISRAGLARSRLETSALAVLFVKFGLGVNRVASNEVAGEIRKPVRPEAVRGAATLLLQRERTTCAQAAGRPTIAQAARSPPPRPRSTQAPRTTHSRHPRHAQTSPPTAARPPRLRSAHRASQKPDRSLRDPPGWIELAHQARVHVRGEGRKDTHDP